MIMKNHPICMTYDSLRYKGRPPPTENIFNNNKRAPITFILFKGKK